MHDMNTEFIGGELNGQSRSPISEHELAELGYRVALKTIPHGEELIICIAVPISWTPIEANQAIKAKFGSTSQIEQGKRSV